MDVEVKPGEERVPVSTAISKKNSSRDEVKLNGLDSETLVTSAKSEVAMAPEVSLSKPSVNTRAPSTEISQSSDLLNGIDLDALEMEMDSIGQQPSGQPQSVQQSGQQPGQPQPVQQPVQQSVQQPVQHPTHQAQPQLIKPQPQPVHPPQQQHPQIPASYSRSPASSPPVNHPLARPSPQPQFPPAMRNQTMLQNIQQSSVIRGPNGQPMIHPPVSGNPQYIQTAQNNAFSTKRTGSYISF